MPESNRTAPRFGRGWADHVRPRLARLQLDGAREAEIIEELSQHLEQRYEELRADGAGDAEARQLAIDELLDPETLADQMRSLRQARTPPPVTAGAPRRLLWADLWQDLRYAARMLTRQRVFGFAAVVTLALGIGANSAMFALVDATLLRPLPLPQPDRLVMIWERTEGAPRGRVAPLNLRDWAERSRTFEAMAAFIPNVGGMVMNGVDGTAETVPRQWVGAGIFDVLGVRPIIGRTFLPADDNARANVVVLTEAFWRTRFNSDPSVVGRDIRLDGDPYTIVGVVPQAADLLGRTSLWAMVPMQDLPPNARSAYLAQVIGRLKPGVTLDAANADLATVAAGLANDYPQTNKGRGVTIGPLIDAVIGGELRQTSLLFLGVVGFVLLICCANVASLLMTRASVRRRELALRAALGADRFRVIRQLMTESLLLSLLGGLVGLAIGAAILEVAPSLIPQDLLPAAVTLTFDLRVAGFCAATALAVGLLFGLAPAWQATELSPAQAITSESRTVTGRGGRIRAALVAAEVATAVVLLVGAGLLLRTLVSLRGVDRGYQADDILSLVVDPLGSQYPTPDALRRFYDAVEQEVKSRPGIRNMAWVSTLPHGDSMWGRSFFEVVGDPPPRDGSRAVADNQIISPAYFETVDLPLVAGRAFTDRDTVGSTAVCMVNEAFVRTHLQGRSPIGLRLSISSAQDRQAPSVVREIVGVARQVKGRPDETQDLIQIYVPLAQNTAGDMFMVVRPASGTASALAPAVRAAISSVDRDQLVSVRDVMTLEDVSLQSIGRYRFRAVLVMTFAVLALLLAMVGVFGVLAYTVEQRVRDVGVRRALGATTSAVLGLVLGDAARVVGAGVLVGLVFAMAFTRLLDTMLYGVAPLDPMTFAVVTIVLLLTAALSIAGPAWRVTRIDPVAALRAD